MNSKYNRLAKNTIIYAIGNFGSKILSFLIVPLYTYVLTTEEYGTIDLVSTTLSLILPFSTMLINEALLRFVVSKEMNEEIAINNCLFIFLIGSFLSVLATPFYKILWNDSEIICIFVLLVVLNSFSQIFGQYLRACGKNVEYTINGLIVTVVSLSSNIFFLLFLKMGMIGYFYSMLLGQAVSIVYILIVGHILPKISIKNIDFNQLKKMIRYSIPLLPNSVMWWIMSGADKYIINYELGNAANGIYSMAMKIPTLITMVFSIFSQAWQISSIEEADDEGIASFFQHVYEFLIAVLSILVSVIILLVKPVFFVVMSDEFKISWEVVPILSIATAVSCLSTFFNVTYIISKQTSKVFLTTSLGTLTNLMLSFFLVKLCGLQGIAIGTLMGYLVVAIIRMLYTRVRINVLINYRKTIFTFIILLIQSYLTVNGSSIISVSGICVIIVILVLYIKEVNTVLRMIVNRFKRK